jgi:hypothetical protein
MINLIKPLAIARPFLHAAVLTLALPVLQTPPLLAQTAGISAAQAGAPMALHIIILDGENALNNIRERTAREPIVQVEDENHKPVAGALVVFTIRRSVTGAGGTFAGAETLTVITGLDGEAVAKGLQPNTTAGSYTITVQASVGTVTTSAVITQTNLLGPPAPDQQQQNNPGTSQTTAGTSGTTGTSHVGFLHHLFIKHFWITAGGVAATTATVVAVVVITHNNGATITAGPGSVHP